MKKALLLLIAILFYQNILAQNPCPNTPTVTDFDGNVYNTVQIGNKCWMKENLKTTHYANGTALVDGTNAGNIHYDYTTNYYFDYDDDTSNTIVYGKLYTWPAVMNGEASSNLAPSGVQGVCPTGWHVPSKQEWFHLQNYLGGYWPAGGKLKETGTTHWISPNSGATNISGFTALPGGYRNFSEFEEIGMYARFWSSYAGNGIGHHSWNSTAHYNFTTNGLAFTTWEYGMSVRCVKDPILNVKYEVSNVSCNGFSDGAINVTIESGMPPFTFLWSNGATTEDLSNLSAGFYSVTITDILGIVAENNLTLTEPDEIEISETIVQLSSTGATDGAIDISVLGGTVPFFYLWSYGYSTEDIDNLAAGIYSVNVVDANGCSKNKSFEIAELINTDPTNWTYTVTSTNHSIHIQDTIPITINGIQIESGDYIGVFFDSLGTLVCGGYQIWDSTNTTITAWGEDIGNDGFDIDEVFKWKVWQISTQIEFDFFSVSYNTISFPDSGNFAINGISGISTLDFISSETQTLSISPGWSIISTYIDPFESNIDSIFQLIQQEVIIIKNDSGLIYWPLYGVNNIGNISVEDGYQINMTSSQNIDIVGVLVDPQNFPIQISSGWSIIGYTRTSPAAIASMLSGISSNINIVKNGAGQIYWPQFGINSIGNMNPGEGYQIKMNNAAILTYPPN
ncbi:MAG: hypothetical protein HN704_12100 [Bacteroidetes bacterium]|jgi:uncharacterized protein (TIGR02145 family)|nr:hypothetical protein [Bacteroidota bacterium]MBT6836015.1 hypothetical protein [Bacteroidota bacterium]MBT7144730.1 hypothetical protein [Bacteroidota bacterium]MBT7492334.1 hypothetical protein [Bacteroidota bacterium]